MPKRLTTPPVPRLFGNDMAAADLGISERMLDHVRLRADFPQPIKLGRRILWDKRSLDDFVDKLTNESSAEQWAAIVAAG